MVRSQNLHYFNRDISTFNAPCLAPKSSIVKTVNLVPDVRLKVSCQALQIFGDSQSNNIVNIFKSFLALSKIDFGVLHGGENERWDEKMQLYSCCTQYLEDIE